MKFQGQTFNVARQCARRRFDPRDVGCVDCDPLPGLESQAYVWPSLMRGRDVAVVSRPLAANGSWNIASAPGPRNPRRGRVEVRSGLPRSLPLPMPSSPSLSVQLPREGRSLDKNYLSMDEHLHCTQDYGTLTYDELNQLRRGRGCAKEDSQAVI